MELLAILAVLGFIFLGSRSASSATSSGAGTVPAPTVPAATSTAQVSGVPSALVAAQPSPVYSTEYTVDNPVSPVPSFPSSPGFGSKVNIAPANWQDIPNANNSYNPQGNAWHSLGGGVWQWIQPASEQMPGGAQQIFTVYWIPGVGMVYEGNTGAAVIASEWIDPGNATQALTGNVGQGASTVILWTRLPNQPWVKYTGPGSAWPLVDEAAKEYNSVFVNLIA